MIGQGTIANLGRRVRAVLEDGGQAEGALVKGQSRRRLFDLIGQLGRGEGGQLFDLIRSAGIGPVLEALPSDIAVMVKTVMSSGYPRPLGQGVLCSPRDPRVQVPGLPRYEPHAAQIAFHRCPSRFRVVCSGRRFGKSLMATMEARETALCWPDSLVWLVSPTYANSEKAFNLLMASLPGPVVKRSRYSDLKIELINQSQIEMKSGERPDLLKGVGLRLVILDEAANLDKSIWYESVRPALADVQGKSVLIGTPRGKNWFHELWALGQDPGQDEWRSFRFASWNNLIIFSGGETDKEILAMKAGLPHDVFKQEVEAAFLADGAGVFRNVKDIIFGEPVSVDRMPVEIEKPREGRSYVGGLDLARLTDWTVLCIADAESKRVVFMDRFNRLDWKYQRRRIVEAARRYDASLAVDASGIGDVILQDLREAGVRVDPFKFTSGAKADLIQDLAVAIEQREIGIPDVPVLVNELAIFGYEALPSGAVRYSAPEGHHDDCVIGLALAVRKLKRRDIPWSKLKGMGANVQPQGERADITSASWILSEIKRIEGG